eukprot:CAMPEP_0185274372 /NCGR_PEP_ID=MMETSP1359-20130426/51714_1 /TAXON_ID=552665 /ORGANISM="Bigelowiella longifila, Strain CCMP242" /LENGTH=34 /DNA_ID= /DNA_START= /DNA_END= /DNA_ORIENTATION=
MVSIFISGSERWPKWGSNDDGDDDDDSDYGILDC